MYIKITCNNTHGEKAIRIINTDEVVLAGEEHQEPTYLYDDNGNVAQTIAPTEKLYFVLFKNCGPVRVDQANFDIIEKALLG